MCLPDEGDLLGSEIFSDNAAGLAPSLLAWYGEHPQEGQNSTIFLMGRGFNVIETQVVAGGVDVPEAQRRLISRNVMEIIIPANARIVKHKCAVPEEEDDEDEPDPWREPEPQPGASLEPEAGEEEEGEDVRLGDDRRPHRHAKRNLQPPLRRDRRQTDPRSGQERRHDRDHDHNR